MITFLVGTTIDNTVHGGYATSPYTAIRGGTITVSGNTDVSKHLQERMAAVVVCAIDKFSAP